MFSNINRSFGGVHPFSTPGRNAVSPFSQARPVGFQTNSSSTVDPQAGLQNGQLGIFNILFQVLMQLIQSLFCDPASSGQQPGEDESSPSCSGSSPFTPSDDSVENNPFACSTNSSGLPDHFNSLPDFQPDQSAANQTGQACSARGTGYFPENSRMEGGFQDRKGNRLYTLQDYLAGRAPYVSCAMDTNAFKYGQRICIPELEAKYGCKIPFRVVDTGGAFRGRGTSRIDICTANSGASHDGTINNNLTLIPVAG